MVVDPYNIEILPSKIQGWFKQESRRNLAAFIARKNPKVFIELGSWLGESSIQIAKWLSPEAVLYCVDTWEGSHEHKTQEQWQPYLPTLYHQFLSNVINAGLTGKITPIRSTTREAAKTFGLSAADVIFIDASHEYVDVLADCRDWWPILREGGIMGGDDYDWPNVKRAVDEFVAEYNLQLKIDTGYWEVTK